MSSADPAPSGSLEKGLAVIQTLASAEAALTVAELAQASGIQRTSAYRLCAALERAGWIQTAGDGTSARTRRLDLGPQALGLAVLANSKYDPEARLQPIMDALARQVGATVHCGVLDEITVIHVGRALPDVGAHMAMRVGARDEAHVTSLGKAMLATLGRDEVLRRYESEQLSVRTPNSIATRSELLDDLQLTAERGYALDDEESGTGLRCVGAPVFGVGGHAVLALSVTTTPVHLDGERLAVVAATVCEAAARASAAFGGRAPAGWARGRDAVSVRDGS